MKVQKSAQHYIEAAYDEVEILQELDKHNFDPEWEKSLKFYMKDNDVSKENERDLSGVVQLLNSFIHQGPNGKHFCMIFEIMGVNLLEIIKRYNYKGVKIIKKILNINIFNNILFNYLSICRFLYLM